MSILIKGASSLKEGLYQIQDGKIHAYKGKGGKTEGYDLIEVPTPHGRLIDADELETDAEWSERYDDYTAFSRAQINAAPTIIEAEE